MTIPRDQIEALKAFGYTEDEAQFLYLVATHSGYFLARQFLNFVGAKRGYRTHSLTQKLINQGHATMREYRRNGCIYHLYSRKLYAQIGRENLRNRRRHRLEAIKTRLLSLDFILANQGYQYLESEPEKVAYFTEELRIQKQCLPVKLYMGGPKSEPTLRYFVDRFPLFFSSPVSGVAPVVTFSYADPGLEKLTGFVTHLIQYQPLFRELSTFRLLYISNTSMHFGKATELFKSIVQVPLESDIAADLIRYFKTQSIWETPEFRSLAKSDLLFLNQAKQRFKGERFQTLLRNWKAARITEAEIRAELPARTQGQKIYFDTYLVPKLPNFRAKDDEAA
ncbi:MAG: hypothetical protein WBL70_01235 [Candidatus Acidiferrales bacterium]